MISGYSIQLPIRLSQGLALWRKSDPILPVLTTTLGSAPSQWLEAAKACSSAHRPFSTTPASNAKSKIGSRAHRGKKASDKTVWTDPYTLRLAAAKRAALIARQQGLAEARRGAAGDPIHGLPEATPFVKSLKLAMPSSKIHIPNMPGSGAPSKPPPPVNTSLTSQADILSPENTGVASPDRINYFLSPIDLDCYTKQSKELSRPLPNPNREAADPQAEADAQQAFDIAHATRTAALARITSIENMGGKQRSLINVHRIIEELGRHNTDPSLRAGSVDREGNPLGLKERVGPDTGSSEVQIGLLTAKIKTLAAAYQEGTGRTDKVNKRNLRLLLHRRQKLLKYLNRKDRGGERWRNVIEKLGLTPATWEGEIEVR